MSKAEDRSHNMMQLSLFRDEHVLLNGAIQDLHELRLEEAKKDLQEYQDIYPNGESVDDKLKLCVFLLDGLANVSGVTFNEPECLCSLWEDFENYTKSIGFKDSHLISGIKKPFYKMIVDSINRYELVGAPFLGNKIPT